MASSSAAARSSQLTRWKYDVFLSFRGEDTRKTFTGHLYEGMKNREIFTFQDDKRLENGDSIPEELLKAIEESQVALVIFSKNYATSSWCLNELVKIMECNEVKKQIVIPVFYDVDPSEVRHQIKSFAEAFSKHESRYKDDVDGMQMVQGRRSVVTASASIIRYVIRDKNESECIRELVDNVSSKICKTSSSSAAARSSQLTIFSSPPSLIDLEDIPYCSIKRWFVWNHFPWESLPENCEPKRLVHLQLRISLLRHLWTGIKFLSSLRWLNLSNCNLKDGGLPEDIESLSSLKYLNLDGNNFEHLPLSISRLGALRSLSFSHCLDSLSLRVIARKF